MAAEAEATREARAKVSCLLIDFHWLIQFSYSKRFFGFAVTKADHKLWFAANWNSKLLIIIIDFRFRTSVANSRWSQPKENSAPVGHWRRPHLSLQVEYLSVLAHCVRMRFTLLHPFVWQEAGVSKTTTWKQNKKPASLKHWDRTIPCQSAATQVLLKKERGCLLGLENRSTKVTLVAGFLCLFRLKSLHRHICLPHLTGSAFPLSPLFNRNRS